MVRPARTIRTPAPMTSVTALTRLATIPAGPREPVVRTAIASFAQPTRVTDSAPASTRRRMLVATITTIAPSTPVTPRWRLPMVRDVFTWRARALRQDAVLPIRVTPLHEGATTATQLRTAIRAYTIG